MRTREADSMPRELSHMTAMSTVPTRRKLPILLEVCLLFILVTQFTGTSALNNNPSGVAQTTTIPPLIDVPTYSMATCNDVDHDDDDDDKSTTNMNILTYATPVSVRPDRVWSIGLFKDTLSHKNFVRDRTCILQLLTESHIPIIKLLGGSSGSDANKQEECKKLGFDWQSLMESSTADSNYGEDEKKQVQSRRMPLVLQGCAYYLKLSAIGDMIDCGSHDVAICKVEEMFVPSASTSDDNDNAEQETQQPSYLSTGRLRELGIITEQGRIAE